MKSRPEKRHGDYICRGYTLDLGRTFEERNLEIANHNANAEQYLGRESGLAIAPAAEATNGVGYANITEHLRTLQNESLLGQVAGSEQANGVRSENTTEQQMNMKATTVTGDAGLKTDL